MIQTSWPIARHRLVREAHVLVHAARMRIAVRAHDPDLQRTSSGPPGGGPMAPSSTARTGPMSPPLSRWPESMPQVPAPWHAAGAGRRRGCGGSTSTRPSGRVVLGRRRRRGSRRRSSRETRSTPTPMPSSTWASELPTAGSRSTSALSRSRAARRARPAADGFMSSIASSWCRAIGAAVRRQQRPRAERWRQRRHRVRGDRDPALVVDALQRLGQRPQRRDALGDEQRQHVAAPRRDLLADHQVEAVVAGGVDLARAHRAVDPLVIGDGDHVEIGLPPRRGRAWPAPTPCRPSRGCGGACRPCRGRRRRASRGVIPAKVRPERLEGAPPLLRRLADVALEAGRDPRRPGRRRPRAGRRSAGTSNISPSARKRSGPTRRQRPTTSAAPCVTASTAGPSGTVVGCPNIVTGWPSPARSRSPMMPTMPPSRSRSLSGAARSLQRHQLDGRRRRVARRGTRTARAARSPRRAPAAGGRGRRGTPRTARSCRGASR